VSESHAKASKLPLAGRLLGGLSLSMGTLLVLHAVAVRLFDPLRRQMGTIPVFDDWRRWNHLYVTLPEIIFGALLILVGWALLNRKRWAPWIYLLVGWGGLAIAVKAFWWGETLFGKANLWLNMAKKQGQLPPDAVLEDLLTLIPSWIPGVLIATVSLLLLVLILGTIHVLVSRRRYDA